jgi:hypothetical protein
VKHVDSWSGNLAFPRGPPSCLFVAAQGMGQICVSAVFHNVIYPQHSQLLTMAREGIA